MFHPISSLDVNITSCFMQKSRKIYCIDYKKNLGHFLSKNLCAIFFSKKSFESILSLNNVVASRKNQKNSMQWFLENSISLIQGQFGAPFKKKKKKKKKKHLQNIVFPKNHFVQSLREVSKYGVFSGT